MSVCLPTNHKNRDDRRQTKNDGGRAKNNRCSPLVNHPPKMETEVYKQKI